MLPITIDYNAAVSQAAGIGRLVRHQTAALFELDSQTPYQLFFSSTSATKALPLYPNVNVRQTLIPSLSLLRLWHRLHIPLPVEIWCGATSLYHATDFVLPPVRSHTKTIVTVHDLSFAKVPEAAPAKLKRFLDRVVPDSIRRATHVIADSESTKNDIIEIYGTDVHKLSVVLSGVESRFKPTPLSANTRQRYSIPDKPYLFSVGTVQPRKNYSRVIKALHSLGNKYEDIIFVIAGGKGWLQDEMYATIQQTEMQHRVYLIGFADDEDLPALYSNATITVVPSLYEGFGFPVLESMACGTPVITSNLSSLPEVAGNAAILVDPYSVSEIATAIETLLTSSEQRKMLVQRGLEQASLFTWQRSAAQLLQVYANVLQLPLGHP